MRNRTAGGLQWKVQDGEKHRAARDSPGSRVSDSPLSLSWGPFPSPALIILAFP